MTELVNTSMRNAFSDIRVSKAQKIEGTAALVLSALKRKVGITKRNTMWSVQRGNGRK